MTDRPVHRPRLRTVLLVVNLLILLLPLGGIAILRLYENELIRSTEAQLLAQGSVLREAFRREMTRDIGNVETTPPVVADRPTARVDALNPTLDISRDRVTDPAPPAKTAGLPADPAAAAIGAALSPLVRNVAQQTLAGVRIVDAAGVVVATSGGEAGLSLSDRTEVATALAGRQASVLRRRVSDTPTPPLPSISRGQRYRVFVALPISDRGRVVGAIVLSRTPLDISKALYLNRRPLLIGAAALFAVVVGVTLLTSTMIARPLRALASAADRAAAGRPGALAELASPGVDEIARLSQSLAQMARSLEHRAEYIRNFAGHVSHEFKTPLATIRGSAELLEDHAATMPEAERQRMLSRIQEACARLDALVSRLLDLARADVLRPAAATCDLRAAAERVIARFRSDGLHVEWTGEAAPVIARIDKDVFEQVLGSLLDNARSHGGPDVTASVATSARGDEAVVIVSDDGPGVSEANAARLFTPFFTTARDRGGSGLALVIARSLMEAHRGSLTLKRPGPGAVFEIRAPLVRASPDHS